MFYTYYVSAFENATNAEIAQMNTEEYSISVPVYPNGDANYPVAKEIDVTIVAPKGYDLTDEDHARIGELLAGERPVVPDEE